MPEVKWIKLTTSMFDDEKIKLIESMPDKDTILIIWIKLLVQAGRSNASGYIYINESIPCTDEMLATLFNRPLDTVRLALEVFEKFGMIEINPDGICISNWEKHQNIDKLNQIREQGRLRQQKYRERQKQIEEGKENNVSVTLCNALDLDLDKDKDLDKDLVKKDSVDKIPYEEIKNLYNQLCPSLPRITKITDSRKRHIKARWKEVSGNIDVFKGLFEMTEKSKFLTGNNDRDWKADFDWLIKNNDNYTKVLEGKYSNDRAGSDKDRASPEEQKIIELVKNELSYDIQTAEARELLKYANNNIDLIKEKILEARKKELDPAQTYYWFENAIKKTNPLYKGYR